MSLIYRTLAGSHLHGTAIASSDTDYKGVFIPSKRDLYLQRTKDVLRYDLWNDISDNCDVEYFSLTKFIKMLKKGELTAIEILLSYPQMRDVGIVSDRWREIYDSRQLFLNRNVSAMIGYCRHQVKEFGQKSLKLNIIKETIELFRIAIGAMTKHAYVAHYEDQWEILAEKYPEHVKIKDIDMPGDTKVRLLNVCGRSVAYTADIRMGFDIYNSFYEKAGHRVKAASTNENVDWKSMAHAVRIGEECIELLMTGNIIFPRHNSKFLIDIKTGKVTYNEVSDLIEGMQSKIDHAVERSILPEKNDEHAIDDFIFSLCERYLDTNESNKEPSQKFFR